MNLHSSHTSDARVARPTARSSDGEPSLPEHLRGLLEASAYSHPVDAIDVKETHISWIVLTGHYAYKIKKPVQFEFLDASQLERRRELCEEELRLNRRLAPSLYLEVAPITQDGDRLKMGGTGHAIEYAVRMQQFREEDELISLLRRDAVSSRDMHELANAIAQFHLHASAVRMRADEPEQLQSAIFENLNQLAASVERSESLESVKRLRHWTHAEMAELADEFRRRSASGFVRECHGDLHAGNIVRIDGRLIPFDCVEFDAALRTTDVMSDVAFLVMDLQSRGRPDLACVFLSRYLEITGDYEGLRVLPFYAVYRALVRAKVDALGAKTVRANRAEYLHRLQRRLDVAIEWTRPRRAALVIMHGVSGSGKSWFSEHLIGRLRAIRIRSDIERKRINLPRTSDGTHVAELYSRLATHRTYSRLLDCAEIGLIGGFNMIADATFLDRADRELFRALADATGASFTIVVCHADEATLHKRIAARNLEALDPSDADARVLEAQLHSMQPLNPIELQHAVELDTGDPESVKNAWARIEARTKN